mmetsp:Transcript_70784/g.124900  ORF Transcript_70784/g.124900 Transcript_70784/m.124900 type:complete len:98 (-) Transcript_70784:1638-1931(-)
MKELGVAKLDTSNAARHPQYYAGSNHETYCTCTRPVKFLHNSMASPQNSKARNPNVAQDKIRRNGHDIKAYGRPRYLLPVLKTCKRLPTEALVPGSR